DPQVKPSLGLNKRNGSREAEDNVRHEHYRTQDVDTNVNQPGGERTVAFDAIENVFRVDFPAALGKPEEVYPPRQETDQGDQLQPCLQLASGHVLDLQHELGA